MVKKLTDKEEKFCQEYVKCLNKTKAAIAAGYSERSARLIGAENHTKPYIKERIADIRQEIKEELGIDEHSVFAELAALAYYNIQDFIGEGNTMNDLSKMDRSKLKPITGIVITERKRTVDGIIETNVRTEFKMADKRASLIDLGRYLGSFEKDNNQKLPPVSQLSDYQFEQLLKTAREAKADSSK